MVEQQVDEKFVAAHVQQYLPSDEGKASAQFQQKFGDMFYQGVFDLTLSGFAAQSKKVQAVWVFQ